MRKENTVSGCGACPARITRSRLAASRAASSALPPKHVNKPAACSKLKRTAPDETHQPSCPAVNQLKKRAVLGDVTNVCSSSLHRKGKAESRKTQKPPTNHSRPRVHVAQSEKDVASSAVEDDCPVDRESAAGAALVLWQSSQESSETLCLQNAEVKHTEKTVDLDRDHKNPQMCSHYAVDIYLNLRAAELVRRPLCNFMETRQRDITQSMRAILIDWLVEVSEEYKLVPDTLYLTVYIIDRYLSDSCIERQKLQLLGITSLLIACKYEEIFAPRVEELCFMTDNTYTRSDVLKMESQVVNQLNFRLSVPTVKTFLRRFLRAAQASYEVEAPSLSLEFLANYLAELTLVDYGFLRFLPSLVAAAAVFLARWTLDDSSPPWNSTLEHYTRYRYSDLKAAALELQELQVNAMSSPAHAIRQKYSQVKFKSVATVTLRRLSPVLFP